MCIRDRFIIITSKTEEIGHFIKDDLNRSATVLKAKGLYMGRDFSVYLCTTSKMEAPKFQIFIKNIDPHAFITIVNTSTVMGKGWYQTDELSDE